MDPKLRNGVIAAAIAAMVVLAGIGLVFLIMGSGGPGGEMPRATMDDLLNSVSVRKPGPDTVYVEKDDPYMVLVGTPIATYYEQTELVTNPLLCVGTNNQTPDEGVSKSVTTFTSKYSPSQTLGIGEMPDGIKPSTHIVSFCPMIMSTEAAELNWESSDGAIIVRWDQEGYNLAVNVVPLASYLNIPVIVTYTQPPEVAATLAKLGVKYTILCGDVPGYGKIWPIESKEEVQAILATGYPDSTGTPVSVLEDRCAINTSYIVMANPNDIHVPQTLESFTEEFSGTVKHSDTGSTSFPSSSADAPTFYMTIPENYTYSRVTIYSEMDCVPPRNFGTPQSHGERHYVYFGMDHDKDGKMVDDSDSGDDTIHFMSPSLAYSYSGSGSSVMTVAYTDYPIFNSSGEKCIQVKASLDYKVTQDELIPGPGVIRDAFASETTFRISVTVEKLDSYIFPRLFGGSSLAPYWAANRGGIVMACTSYGVHDEAMVALPNSGDPAVNEDIYTEINSRTMIAKSDLNILLGKLAGVDGTDWVGLADHYGARDPTDPMYVGIVADPFMVPWLYYHNGQGAWGASEGYGTPSDNGYADIDVDVENLPMDLDGAAPDMELAIGRITGWDIQDSSAQMARTFFYYDIVDQFPGHSGSFKESAISTHGTVVPVGLAETVVRKLQAAWTQAGFNVDTTHNFARSDSKLAGPYYETSNFIFECAHGHYYWFVPTGYKGTGPGGGFHVANVQDMNFGPGVLFASSCVTGKIDGIPLYNAVSQAFVHSGLNCYVGASRLSWGTFAPPVMAESGEAFGGYLGLLFYGYLTGYVYNRHGGLTSEGVSDLSVGAALMMAKNYFVKENGSDGGGAGDDTVEEFNIHGDPAFNPYEPNHNG